MLLERVRRIGKLRTKKETGLTARLDGRVQRAALSGADQYPGYPCASRRARGWDHAHHAPGPDARLVRDRVSARTRRGAHETRRGRRPVKPTAEYP